MRKVRYRCGLKSKDGRLLTSKAASPLRRKVRPYVCRNSEYLDGIALLRSMVTCRPYPLGRPFLVPNSGSNEPPKNHSSFTMLTNCIFPRLKFCGFTRLDDLEDAIRFGVDAIGLNFYPKSPRCLSHDKAAKLSLRAKGSALRVGVFVDEDPRGIAKLVADDVIDVVQLHGDEDMDYLRRFRSQPELSQIPILRAVSWRGEEFPEDEKRVREWSSQSGLLGFLVDAHDPVQRGGTGKRARWDLLSPRPEAFGAYPYLLAGGITSENAEQAIRLVQPDGLDLASGIESSPGIKDRTKMGLIAEIASRLLVR